MTWNHRVLKQRRKLKGMRKSESLFTIREVFYDSRCRPDGYTQEPIAPMGSTLAELREELIMMLNATRHPVLRPRDCYADKKSRSKNRKLGVIK